MFTEFHGVTGLLGRSSSPSNFPTKSDQSKFIVVSYEDYAESTGIIVETIAYYLDHRFPIVFVSLGQPFEHYSESFQMHGYNVESLVQDGLFYFVDGLKLFLDLYEEYSRSGYVSSDNPLSVICNDQQPERLKPLYDRICLEISRLRYHRSSASSNEPGGGSGGEARGLLVVDDLNVLLTVGIPISDVMDFVQYCRGKVMSNFEDGNLIVKISMLGKDKQIEQLVTFLGHLSDIYLEMKAFNDDDIKGEHRGKVLITAKQQRENEKRCVIPMNYTFKGKDLELFRI